MTCNNIWKFFAAILAIGIVLEIKFASAAICGGGVGIYCNPTSTPSLYAAILIIVRYLFSIIGIVCLIFMVIAGIKYATSAGSEQNITSSKEAFTSAALGLVVALLAYGILDVIQGILNG